MWQILRRLLPLISPYWLERWRVGRARRSFGIRPAARDRARRRLLVDVTVIAKRDVHTGIQRVVRSVMLGMSSRPHGRIVQPVRYIDGSYRHTAWPGLDLDRRERMTVGPDDVFLGLDLSFDAIRRQARQFLRYRRSGARFWFVVYDLLPLQTPQHFSAKVAVRFRWWLISTAKVADGYLCISPHVAEELRSVLHERFGGICDVRVETIPMGFDIVPDAASVVAHPREQLDMKEFVLAVGTVEPRKGYALVLDAFERLWADGAETALLIVGGPGWKTESLQRRIVLHREYGRRLRWLSEVDDAELLGLYDSAVGLIAASTAEGFGLPVFEAVARSCPVLARDIPAFRAHAAYGIRFFEASANAAHLASHIQALVRDGSRMRASADAVRLPTWREVADYLQDVLDPA